MELTDSLSRTNAGQEMEDAPGLTGMAEQGLADEFDFGAIGDELGPEAPLHNFTYYGHLLPRPPLTMAFATATSYYGLAGAPQPPQRKATTSPTNPNPNPHPNPNPNPGRPRL